MTKIHPPPIFFTMISIATRAILAGVIGIFPLYLSANPVRSNEPITLNFQAAEIEGETGETGNKYEGGGNKHEKGEKVHRGLRGNDEVVGWVAE